MTFPEQSSIENRGCRDLICPWSLDYFSDISGQDIHSHGGTLKKLIEEVAMWLRAQSRDPKVPGGRKIAEEFESFRRKLPRICGSRKIEPDELTFGDYTEMVVE